MFQIETISAKMLDDYVGRKDALIIDLRDREEYRIGHVATAVNVPYDTLEDGIEFPRNKMLVLYCERGGSSMDAARKLGKKGYKVCSVIGGIEAYRGRNRREEKRQDIL